MVLERDTGLPFMKMHGLGNDFVVLDGRTRAIDVTEAFAKAVAHRRTGIGCDQLALVERDDTGVRLSFWNADGSTSAACGNATRCIARWLMDEAGRDALTLTTAHGTLNARDAGDGLTSVNMGQPQLLWHEIPLAHELDTLHLPIAGDPVATGMGNPHCSFFVEDAEAAELERIGAGHETHPLFPQRTNVQVASLRGTDHLRMRVWERGAGVTLASGSSSCAVAVAAHRRGLTGRTVRIDLDGGTILVDWRADGVWMTGPTAHVCDGMLTPEFLRAIA